MFRTLETSTRVGLKGRRRSEVRQSPHISKGLGGQDRLLWGEAMPTPSPQPTRVLPGNLTAPTPHPPSRFWRKGKLRPGQGWAIKGAQLAGLLLLSLGLCLAVVMRSGVSPGRTGPSASPWSPGLQERGVRPPLYRGL